ncbi:ABC transporter ATP-binding protein [Salidesulfovibrio onnuriiensis]|uniref:ABC transporter ATP-binding protein n=1 Tax=Salidesulfovibrio onnuriiensis TaxID=2583823 RepID=UPI0011CC8B44|nr:ABC transporter transmembrane domain-containing protein [Salidesulfovibrio onnuriiensis]
MSHTNLDNIHLFSSKYLLRRCWEYFKPYKWYVLISLAMSSFYSACDGALVYIVKPAIDEIFISKDSQMLLIIPIVAFGIVFVKSNVRFIQNYLMCIAGYRVLEQLRNDLFAKVVALPFKYFEASRVGVLMSRILGDVAGIRESVPHMVMIVREVLKLIFVIGVVVYQDVHLAFWALIVLPVVIYPFIYFGKRLRKLGRRLAVQAAEINSVVQETLSGIRVIKTFNTEKRESSGFKGHSAEIVTISKKQVLASEASSRMMELISGLGISLVIWYGGLQVVEGSMTPGTLFSFIVGLAVLYEPVKKLDNSNRMIQKSLACAERVFGLLDDPNVKVESGGVLPFPEEFESLEIGNITFSYESCISPVLKDFNLTIRRGECVALVGPSGSGKTTLANLIPRFYDVQEGSLRLNGIELGQYDLGKLRLGMGMVSQDTFLFNSSVAQNIAYGHDDIDREAVALAAKAAYAHEFIENLPEGYDTVVGERGTRLSGGQKQRLTIARALFKNPQLLILDEATSALDTESERIVQKALDNLMKSRTSIVIAHRLSTVINADRIVVMQQGEIVDVGSHEELLGRCELYDKLYSMQFREAGEDSGACES